MIDMDGENGGLVDVSTLNLPLGRPHPLVGGGVNPPLGRPTYPADEATPEEATRYLEEVLEPAALQTYRDLLLDPDPKVRRQAASDVMEMRGMKGKVAPNLGGITFNLAPDRATKLIEGLSKVFQKPVEVVDVG